jgi:hypothetical protein
MAEFLSAEAGPVRPLTWTSFAPPFSPAMAGLPMNHVEAYGTGHLGRTRIAIEINITSDRCGGR